jgi:GT2 family glycosyltransferase
MSLGAPVVRFEKLPVALRETAGTVAMPAHRQASQPASASRFRSRVSLTVVVVNWNGGDLLIDCLERIRRQTVMPERIIVMDNGSADGSAARAGSIDGVHVQNLQANVGFAAANNRALEGISTEYVALLNPDALAEPDWLERLLAAADAHPEVAAFASRQMVLGDDRTLDGAGDVYHASGLVWRHRYRHRICDDDLIEREVFSPCAAAALFRRDALRDVGGLDESYFCYVEDIDLGFRLRLAGHRCIYVPGAVVHHAGSYASGGPHSEFALYHGHRNLVWTFVKNMPGLLFWVLLPLHLVLNVVTIVVFALRGHGGVLLRAKRDAIAGLPRVWRVRRQVQKSRVVSLHAIWRALDKTGIFKQNFGR